MYLYLFKDSCHNLINCERESKINSMASKKLTSALFSEILMCDSLINKCFNPKFTVYCSQVLFHCKMNLKREKEATGEGFKSEEQS